MQERINNLISEHIAASERLLEPAHAAAIERIASLIVEAYRSGRKVVVFGNGGSAADAQHFAAELVVRFTKNRAALPALALSTNTSSLTAIGNDFGFDQVFSRQVEALVAEGDVVVGISTSGTSPNVLKGIEEAARRKALTVGFAGAAGGSLKEAADTCFCAPSSVTARIQECHILAIHIICTLVEDTLFGER